MSGNVYGPSNALQAQNVATGTVTNVRTVEIRSAPGNSDRVIGAIAGGSLGSYAGNELGDGNTLATGAGALLGALAGDAAARRVNRIPAQEWTVNLDRGGTIAVVQNDTQLFVGQRVRVINDGNRTRLAP
jgi:outer membrane lipoprotein SlyB